MGHQIVINSLWALAAACAAWCGLTSARTVTYVARDGARIRRRLPLLIRVLLPLAPTVAGILFSRSIFNGTKKRLDRQITAAGYDEVVTGAEVLGLRVLTMLTLGPLLVLLIWRVLILVPSKPGLVLRHASPMFYVGAHAAVARST